MSIKWFLYKIALKYIGWCNGKPSDIMYDHLKKMDRLTYHDCDKAYLSYGADSEWSKFKSYEVLDNAIQKLAEYEDENEDVSLEAANNALHKVCECIGMEWALDGGTEYVFGRSKMLNENVVCRNGEVCDLRGDLFVIIRNLAVSIFHDKEYEHEDYIFRDSAFSNFVRCRVDISKDEGGNDVDTNNRSTK